jgi:hypothetical protein
MAEDRNAGKLACDIPGNVWVPASQSPIRIMHKLMTEPLAPPNKKVGQVAVSEVSGGHEKVLGQVCFCAEAVSDSDSTAMQSLLTSDELAFMRLGHQKERERYLVVIPPTQDGDQDHPWDREGHCGVLRNGVHTVYRDHVTVFCLAGTVDKVSGV